MSVLIKGMTKPSECRLCPMLGYESDIGRTRCTITCRILSEHYKPIPFDGRPDWCPIVEMIHCEDCDWWEKSEASLQGRCSAHGMYPTGAYYCGTARRRKEVDS